MTCDFNLRFWLVKILQAVAVYVVIVHVVKLQAFTTQLNSQHVQLINLQVTTCTIGRKPAKTSV